MTNDKAMELINEWLSRGSYEQEMDETARKYKELTGKNAIFGNFLKFF